MSVEENNGSNSVKKPQNIWFLMVFLFLLFGGIVAWFVLRNTNTGVIEKYVSSETDVYFKIRFVDWNKDMFKKFTESITESNLASCTELMAGADEIAMATSYETQASNIFIKTQDGLDVVESCVYSVEDYSYKQLEEGLYVIGAEDSIDAIGVMTNNILAKKEMNIYVNQYDIINYVSFKNQQNTLSGLTQFYDMAKLDYFIFGVYGSDSQVNMDVNIHQNSNLKLSENYKFDPVLASNFQKDTTFFLLELGPIFDLFAIPYEDFSDSLQMAMSQANPDAGVMLSEDDKKAIYSIFQSNIVLSAHSANNILGVGFQISFGNDDTWNTLKKIYSFLKQYMALMTDQEGNKINMKETDDKILISYDKYNLELTNENNKVVGKLLDPIVDIASDKSLYNDTTLATVYYNEKKMLDVFQNFNNMYDREFEMPSLSNMINGLGDKDEVYGNLYMDDGVVRLKFIIK